VKVLPGVIDAPNGLPFPDATFDIVTCWAVIEHVRYPKTALQEVMRLLRPGGIFLCDTPLCDDISEKLVAARSHWFCPPEHIHVFSHRALALLVKEAGLEILHSTPSFERTTLRLILRRTRNFFIGGVLGGALRLISRRQWTTRRQSAVTEIGDIQLFVARSPGKPQLTN
jgi:SAM-dependent methyltransferase